MSWVFTNGLGDWGSIQGQVIPKTQKMVFDASLHNTQHYKVPIKGEVVEQSRNGVLASPTLQYSSYWKGSLWVTLLRLLTTNYILNIKTLKGKNVWILCDVWVYRTSVFMSEFLFTDTSEDDCFLLDFQK